MLNVLPTSEARYKMCQVPQVAKIAMSGPRAAPTSGNRLWGARGVSRRSAHDRPGRPLLSAIAIKQSDGREPPRE